MPDILAHIATRENAGEYFSNWTGVLPDPDPILRKMGDGAQILDDLAADDQVSMAIMARKNRVLNKRNYHFLPGAIAGQDASPAAVKVCEQLTADLENLKMTDVLSGIMDAPFYGFSVLEICWESVGGWWRIKGLELKPNNWFAFNSDNKLVLKGQNYQEAQALPEDKFILTQHFPTYNNPYGLRLLSRCLWPVAFKKGGITFYTRFLEKYGTPWAALTAAQGASETEKTRMVADLARMAREGGIVIPYGASLQLLDGASGQAGNLYPAYINLWNATISKVLMGQTMTAEISGEVGAYAASKTQEGTADDFALADQHMVIGALNELSWRYSRLNAGHAEMAPTFSYNEPEDLSQKAELDQKLYIMGVRFKPEHFADQYGLAPENFEISHEPAPTFGQSYSFSTPDKKDNFSVIEDAVRKYAPSANNNFIKQLEEVIDEAQSFDELENSLAGLLGENTGPDELEELLADLMINANLMGRFTEGEKRK